ncbi:hypothetical protein CCACVL1_07560 [Corchorus capsularis]|uniref:Uncharacterized protein n=1 Tax=Corchorus capsularis TaxID=210143 RepID=A0A1R3J556_COCAP|nr:hypothetical protein CCACVL1_07560 [Corchorus capsularis]
MDSEKSYQISRDKETMPVLRKHGSKKNKVRAEKSYPTKSARRSILDRGRKRVFLHSCTTISIEAISVHA